MLYITIVVAEEDLEAQEEESRIQTRFVSE